MNTCHGEYVSLVPKDFQANLRWRETLLNDVRTDKAAQKELWMMCARDVLFYFNAVCWTYDPRRKSSPVIPFVTYDFQDTALTKICNAIGTHDLLMEKSRDMGASWMLLGSFQWAWQFHPNLSFLLGSRKEEFVDKRGDPKSLFWKVDFLVENQPPWLKPNFVRQSLHFHNQDNGSTIDGESTNENFARGDRRTAIGLDEFAAVPNSHAIDAASQHATNCCIYNSTPQGTGNAFSDIRDKIPDDWKISMHWTLHPEKAVGLYHDEKGKARSPWYDRECLRTAHPQLIAQELDIDYLGSGFQFIDSSVLQLMRDRAREPLQVGEIDYDTGSLTPLRFVPTDSALLSLWIALDPDGFPPRDREYAVGVDIATGTGASNSVISVIDKLTGEQVAEWSHSMTRPEELAKVAVVIARWFAGVPIEGQDNSARMIWEANGPGRAFGNAVIESGFGNIFYRRAEGSISKKVSDIPGWQNSKETAREVLTEYRRAIADEELHVNSLAQAKEASEYVYAPDQSIVFARSMNIVDPSGAKQNHGDRVVATSLAWWITRQEKAVTEQQERVALPGSFMYRRQIAERQAATTDWW